MANDLLNPPETETPTTTSGTPAGNQTGSLNGAPASWSTASSQPEETGHELDAFLGKAFEEKSAFTSLFESIHEVFFPTKLPPLELTSTPIPVADPLAVKRSPASIAISVLVNAAILALLLFAFKDKIPVIKKMNLSNIDVNLKPYIPVTKKAGNIGGGGGGGSHDILPPSKGRLPDRDPKPLIQPQVQTVKNPIIPLTPKIDLQPDIKLPDNPNLANLGVSNSKSVVLSNGGGSGGGIGQGKGGGVGTGNGAGVGPGTGGNTGGGLRRVGDGVTAPKAIFQPEAEFSDEARRAKYEGTVVVTLIVDANGNPQNVHVSRTLGMGLDEKAVEAVQKYKFKPALDQTTGKGVPVMVSVEVRFRLY
jgi:TonB family protein